MLLHAVHANKSSVWLKEDFLFPRPAGHRTEPMAGLLAS